MATEPIPVVPMSAPTREFLNSIAGMGAGAMPVPTQATPVVQFPTLSTPSNVLTPSPGVRNMLYVIPPLGDTSGSGVTLSVYIIPPPGTQTGPLVQNMGWRETGQATLNGIAGAVSGAGAGAVTGAATGAVATIITGPGVAAGAGATAGAIVGGISGFIRGAFYAENPQDALEKGVTIGATTGGVAVAVRVVVIAATAEAVAVATAPTLATLTNQQLQLGIDQCNRILSQPGLPLGAAGDAGRRLAEFTGELARRGTP